MFQLKWGAMRPLSDWKPLALGALYGVLLGFFIWALLFPSPADRAACDRAFATFMATQDTLELQRATFLLQELDCRIGKRLRSQAE